MISKIILILVGLLIFFGIAIFTALTYTSTLKLNHPINKTIVGIVLLVPLMFIASIISSRSVQWGIGSMAYTIINCIAGVFFYIFLGAIILSIIWVFCLVLNKTIPVYIPWFILFTTALLGLFGLVESRFIKTVTYEVGIPNLPTEWIGKKILLVSDTHFGLINQKKFSDKVVNKILLINPDIVIHAGDFYDGPKIDLKPISDSWKNIAAKIPVFYAPGNHELYGDYNSFIQSINDANITVLENKKIDYKGIQIAGITYQPGKDSISATQNIDNLMIDPSKPSILINHPPTSLQEAEKTSINLMVSGHTHNGQFWPNNFVVKRIYGKQAYGHQFFKKMQTITTSGVGTYGPPLRLFNRPELVIITLKK